jgi:putative copper resistance protein D
LIAHRLAGICSRRPRAGQPWREGALLVALMFVLGWHRRRGKVETAFPLGRCWRAAHSLRWHGTATPPLARAAGAVRLAAGIVHLLAAGGWIAAVLMFLAMLLRGKETNGGGRLRST